jgi:capsular polysaccharide transport system permease protein
MQRKAAFVAKTEGAGSKEAVTPLSPDIAKIHVVSKEEAHKSRWTAQKWRRFWTIVTFFPCVVLPVIAAVIYLSSFASDRFAVEAKFSIRSPAGVAPSDILGMMSGISSSGSTVLDSYVVTDYIQSSLLLEQLEQRMDLRSVYDHENADLLYRFDRERSKEDFQAYFQRMVDVYYDTSSQVITIEVTAFTPQDAKTVADNILILSQQLVNDISEQARVDTVRVAQAELTRAEDALREHRRTLAAFREQQQEIDPTAAAAAQQTLLSTMEGELSVAQTELDSLGEFLDSESPQIRIRKSQIAALSAQIDAQRALLSSPLDATGLNRQSLTARVGTYEEMAVDLEFLQRAYLSSLVTLEAARLEADRQQRYVATFVAPTLPETAAYPRKVRTGLIVFVFSLMLWGIATMTVYIVREHAI